MRRLSILLALLCGSASPIPAQPAQIPWDAIVLIDCGKAMGTAFHIGRGRYITADHVLKEGGGPCSTGTSKLTLTGEVPDLDIAELSGPVIDAKLELNCSGFKAGQQYLSIGYAFGAIRTEIPLIYSSFGHDHETGNSTFIGADVIPGMSGGPMIGTDYRVWGFNLERWPSRARDLSGTYLCGKAIA